jgi:hypothetical protein
MAEARGPAPQARGRDEPPQARGVRAATNDPRGTVVSPSPRQRGTGRGHHGMNSVGRRVSPAFPAYVPAFCGTYVLGSALGCHTPGWMPGVGCYNAPHGGSRPEGPPAWDEWGKRGRSAPSHCAGNSTVGGARKDDPGSRGRSGHGPMCPTCP